MMTVAASRRLCNSDVTFVGIGLPSKAANLARLTHAPDVTLIYESGPIGAAQVDKFGNINTTVIGDYHNPKVRLPGAGGAPEIAGSAKKVFIILKQGHRTFVDKLAFITSVGHGEGGEHRQQLGLPGAGPVAIITDLCIMEPEAGSKEFVVTSIHPGVSREQIIAATGWPIRFAEQVAETEVPQAFELEALRALEARTAAAHGQAGGEE